MDNNNDSTRLKRISNELVDSAENSFIAVGQRMISAIINDAESWLMQHYEKWKKSRSFEPKYKQLQKYIEVSNDNVQIGMDKKEIAVMWAMRELGYTEEQTQEVLDLANKAYLPKEKR